MAELLTRQIVYEYQKRLKAAGLWQSGHQGAARATD